MLQGDIVTIRGNITPFLRDGDQCAVVEVGNDGTFTVQANDRMRYRVFTDKSPVMKSIMKEE